MAPTPPLPLPDDDALPIDPAPPPPHTQPPLHGAPSPHRGSDHDEVVYAGFVRRWAALLLDQMILAAALIGSIVLLVIADPDDLDQGGAMLPGLFFLWLVSVPLYFAGTESSRHQATLGKRAFAIKVTDLSGRRLSFVQALGRWFAATLSYLTLCLGFLMAAFTQRKRALHDFVAGTLVLDRWAYTEHPERQKLGASGSLVAGVIAICLVLAAIATLAAIANVEYESFVIRAQVAEGVSLADGAKTAVEEFYHDEGRLPAGNEAAGVESASRSGRYVSGVILHDGKIAAIFSGKPPQKASSALDGKQLEWVPAISPQGSVIWTCRSEIADRYLPSRCRSANR